MTLPASARIRSSVRRRSPAYPAASTSSARTRVSNGVNDVGVAFRSHRGGESEFTALITVVREIPKRSAILVVGEVLLGDREDLARDPTVLRTLLQRTPVPDWWT